MSERVPAAIAAVSSIMILIYACATAPTTATPNFPRAPLTDSARRVRDSVTAVRRDSAAASVLRSIAGRENQPAESVFKNIKVFKGVPAARLVNIMNNGFGRSLGVGCGFCHVPGKFDLDDREQKTTARLMLAMVQTINRDYVSKVPVDSGRPAPMVSCFTCHRGRPQPATQEPPPRAPGTTQ